MRMMNTTLRRWPVQKRSIQTCGARPAWLMRILMPCLLGLIFGVTSDSTWAYKTEKVCSDSPATASEPAKKVCKIVRIPPGQEPAPKEEKKEEKKKSGH
jgi:hypothetical protein